MIIELGDPVERKRLLYTQGKLIYGPSWDRTFNSEVDKNKK